VIPRLALLLLLVPQEPTIRLDVQQVLVPVIVTDKKGHHVTGLRASDFQIYEDGVRQDIASFSADTSASVDDIGALSKQASPAPASGPRRTFVICLDTLHTAPASAARMRDALVSLFDKEKPADAQYVLIAIGRQMQVLQPATSNPQVLLLKVRGAAFTSAMGGLDSSALAAELQNLRGRMDDFCKRCPCGTRPAQRNCDSETEALKQSVDSLAARWTAPASELVSEFGNVVKELAKLPTARSLILVSDGFNVDPKREFYSVIAGYLPNRPEFKPPDANAIEPGLRDALKVAADRNVTIYAVDSRGGASPSLASVGPMDAGASLSSGSTSATGMGTDRNSRSASSRGLALEAAGGIRENPFSAVDSATMERLAHATGGVYFHSGSDVAKELRGALADGREYYLLTYVPKNNAQDGRFRAITVETADKNLKIRSKSGYWAAQGVAQ
jgi:VWFA-related protein